MFSNNGIENIAKAMLNFPAREDIQENSCFCLQFFIGSGRRLCVRRVMYRRSGYSHGAFELLRFDLPMHEQVSEQRGAADCCYAAPLCDRES